jgi:hypothetical protein
MSSKIPPVLALFASAAALVTLANADPASALPSNPCASGASPPPGAQALGYTKQAFCVVPTIADISTNDAIAAKLYSGSWYTKDPTPMTRYAMDGSTLVLHPGGGVASESRKSRPGSLPLLPGAAGFYVEFQERLSSNDPDHFPALFLMPQEHDAKKNDHVAGDPATVEHWMELDVDEGGYGPGMHGTVINWSGAFPNYQHVNQSVDSTAPLDRTQNHVFGLSYDPKARRVAWWLDGVIVGSTSTQALPAIVNSYHYYLLMGNQSHGLNKPYDMYVSYFSAWSPVEVPKPPTDVSVTMRGRPDRTEKFAVRITETPVSLH